MENFYHAPGVPVSLVLLFDTGPARGVYLCLAKRGLYRNPIPGGPPTWPLSDLGDDISKLVNYQVWVSAVTPWRAIGDDLVVAYIRFGKFV